jgi:hypothetical protein
MSEHTLSGVDLTNGKRLNLKFTSGDLLGTGDLFDTTKIVEDVRKNKKEKEKNNTEKVDSFVEKVQAASPYTTLSEVSDAYGGLKNLPEILKPNVQINLKDKNLLGTPSLETTSQYKFAGVGDDEEVRAIPGLFGADTKFEVVGKNAPRIGLERIFAGMLDPFIPGDFDKRDNRRLIDLYDPKNFELSKIQSNLVKSQLEAAGIDVTEDDATLGVDKATDKSIEQQKKQSAFDRRERLKDTLQTTATNFATIPFYTRLLEDAAKRRLELDKAMLGAREMMPSNIQNIMLSKQSQRSLASSAFAEEAKALAAQQEAATGFGGLGMQRRFGQA